MMICGNSARHWPPRTAWVVLIPLCLVAAASASQPEWPQWRGPNRNGISEETGLLKEWPKDGPPLLWTATGCGIGFSSVTTKDGLIYTAGAVKDKGTFVLAFDLDGTLRWKTLNGSRQWQVPKDKSRW